jgi:hypothetical protein
MRKNLAATLFVLTILLAFAPAHADLTYNYTGNAFTTIGSPALGTSISGSVTFDSTITAGYTGTIDSTHVVSYTVSTPVGPYTSSTGDLDFTFLNGQITAWWVQGTVTMSPYTAGLITTHAWPGTPYSYDTIWVNTGTGTVGNFNQNSPGTWALAAVPLPSALFLLAPALAGLAALRRKYRG